MHAFESEEKNMLLSEDQSSDGESTNNSTSSPNIKDGNEAIASFENKTQGRKR